MATNTITITGKLSNVAAADAERLAIYILNCNRILAQGPVLADGSYRVNLSRAAAAAPSAYAIQLAVAPAASADHLQHLPDVQKVALSRKDLTAAEKEFRVPSEVTVSDTVLKLWWNWCRQYCVSGTVTGPDGCAAPGANVTVYSVSYTAQGYTKVPRATVTTAPNGTFTACFEWCTCGICFGCWPCWPIWWRCWPWWWEFDLLHVIEAIEKVPSLPGGGPVESVVNNAVNLARPDASSLVRGEGFLAARRENNGPDAQRTAYIKSKFANAQLRAIFPWWWWCCDNPNIVFSVSQGGNVILNENPAINTRWCFADGGSVTLVGNQQTSTVCNPSCPPESGFVWTNVGNVDVSDINQGYAEFPGTAGTDDQDLPFGGNLDLYGQFAATSNVAYYQVIGGEWTGNPARGGTPPTPGTGSPIALTLQHTVYIYDKNGNFVGSPIVVMGPFNQGGLTNLYATPQARQTGPTPPTLQPFPAVPAGGSVYWDKQGLMLSGSSATLVGGLIGAVDLTVLGYDTTLALVTLTPDDPLTLTVDNTGLSTVTMSPVIPYKQDGTVAKQAGTGNCPAYDIGPGGYVQIPVTVSDSNGHLFEYYVNAEWGVGNQSVVSPPGVRGYVSNPLVTGSDPNYAQKSWIGGSEVMTFTPPADTDCCYEFLLRTGKRVTDGYTFPSLSDGPFQIISLKNSA